MPRDVSLLNSKCWNGGHEWVKQRHFTLDFPGARIRRVEHFNTLAVNIYFARSNQPSCQRRINNVRVKLYFQLLESKYSAWHNLTKIDMTVF